MTMYRVIPGHLIDQEDPGFYGAELRESDFLAFVQASQDYFHAWDPDDRETRILGKSAFMIWVDPSNCVEVIKSGGRYVVGHNGHHRAYIAHKHSLDILVQVASHYVL